MLTNWPIKPGGTPQTTPYPYGKLLSLLLVLEHTLKSCHFYFMSLKSLIFGISVVFRESWRNHGTSDNLLFSANC